MAENAKEIHLRESLSSDVMERDLTSDDLKPFLLDQAPSSPVPSSLA